MQDTAELFVDSRCELGEGALWHPLLHRLFWFDIANRTLFSATAEGEMVDRFIFDAPVSAAAVIDADHLAIASATGLLKLQLSTDAREPILVLEADRPGNRSNDGRVGRAGQFWIGTMVAKDAGKIASGALYSVRDGVATTLLSALHVPNAICFSPDGTLAYFSDSATHLIRRIPLDPGTGLPTGEGQAFARVEAPVEPDGAIVDSEGFVWNAHWAGSQVVRYAPDGRIDRVVKVPVSRPTCPALGGNNLSTLYITTSREGLTPEQLEAEPLAGSVFAIEVDRPGLPEPLFRA